MIFTLVYKSKPAVEISTQDIDNIIKIAKKKNSKVDVTGILLFKEGIFLQVLEGSRENVTNLYQKIKNDPRHKDVQTIYEGLSSSRAFESWSMAYKHLDELGQEWLGSFLQVESEADIADLTAIIRKKAV